MRDSFDRKKRDLIEEGIIKSFYSSINWDKPFNWIAPSSLFSPRFLLFD